MVTGNLQWSIGFNSPSCVGSWPESEPRCQRKSALYRSSLTISSIFSDLPVDQPVGDGVGYADSVTSSSLAGFGTNPDQTGYTNCNSGSSAIVVFSVDCDLFSRFPLA